MYGGTLGNAIIKNKLFNFFSLECWKVGYPQQFRDHRAHRAGTRRGLLADATTSTAGCRPSTIRSPRNSNPATGRGHPHAVSRETSSDRAASIPLSASLLKQFWDPNSAGDNITHVNNFKSGLHRDLQLLQLL